MYEYSILEQKIVSSSENSSEQSDNFTFKFIKNSYKWGKMSKQKLLDDV